jgi:quercetin dioxygenase-like cupin family protein
MEISRASEGSFERGDEGRFTGEVWLRSTLTAEDGTNVGVVHFSPKARTHWHRHPGGQFLFGVSGRGRVRTKGAVNGGGAPAWAEPVTDDEYEEGF